MDNGRRVRDNKTGKIVWKKWREIQKIPLYDIEMDTNAKPTADYKRY